MLDISKLLISLSCPASWSLYNNYHFVTLTPPAPPKMYFRCRDLDMPRNEPSPALQCKEGGTGNQEWHREPENFPSWSRPKARPWFRGDPLAQSPRPVHVGHPPSGARDHLPSRLLRALHTWRGPVLSPRIQGTRVFQNAS